MDEANRVKPYFALTHYKNRINLNLFSTLPLEKISENKVDQYQNDYNEYKLREIYIVIEESEILFVDKLSQKQMKCLKSGGIEWCNKGANCYTLQRQDFISIPFDVENTGNGAATNTIIAFYKREGKRKGVSLYTIKKDEAFYIHIFCENINNVVGSKYVLELLYSDIIGNDYSQKYPFKFEEDKKTKQFHVAVDLSGKQEIDQGNLKEFQNK